MANRRISLKDEEPEKPALEPAEPEIPAWELARGSNVDNAPGQPVEPPPLSGQGSNQA